MKPQECPLYKDEIRSVAEIGELGLAGRLEFAFVQKARRAAREGTALMACLLIL
jgi:hypothetical protein